MSDINHNRMIPLHIADQAVANCEKEIAGLKAENARLKAEVERLTALVESNLNSSKVAMGKADAMLHERDSLKAEVERLRKAGDEVVSRIQVCTEDLWCSIHHWNSAKEGKQP